MYRQIRCLLFLYVALTGLTATAQVHRANHRNANAYKNSYSRIDAYESYTLEIRNGGLYGCGDNAKGQLGVGSYTNKITMTRAGTDNDWLCISAGPYDATALKTDGTLWSWGWNYFGEVGDSTTVTRNSPVKISNDTDWVFISSGGIQAMGIKANGTLWGWGDNAFGQLGDGTTNFKPKPTQIGTATDWVYVSTTFGSSFGIKSNGTLWAWGDNRYGKLGDGTTTQRINPVQIGTGTNWVCVKGREEHTLGLKSDGTLWAWGGNMYGRLGDGTTTNRSSPVKIGNDSNWIYIGMSGKSSYAIKSDGTLWAWGFNTDGELGDGTTTDRSSPVLIPNIQNCASVAAGVVHTMITRTDGTVWACGYNGMGQFGNGTTSTLVFTTFSKVNIIASPIWLNLSEGQSFGSAIKSDGSSVTWGSNSSGQIGNGNTVQKNVTYNLPDTFIATAAGHEHTLALKYNGTLWAWGNNSSGQLGDSSTTNRLNPVQVDTLKTWANIAAGYRHSLGLKADGTLWAWGDNSAGQLGDGTNTSRIKPVKIGTLNSWVAIAAGYKHSLALRADGTLWAWGLNDKGQLGDGSTTGRNAPVQVGTLKTWANISCGYKFSFTQQVNGTIWGFGDNSKGQLGDGSTTDRLSPSQAGTTTDWISVSCGFYHTVAIKANSSLWAWGDNSRGQLGDSSYTQRNSPVRINNMYVVEAKAGEYYTTVIKADRSQLCSTGDNGQGQFGDGYTYSRNYFDCGFVPTLPKLSTGSITPTAFCAGSTLKVPFSLNDTLYTGNVFTAQLSNQTGGFSSALNIGSVSANTSDTVVATIPVTALEGTAYKIRVVGNFPIVTGTVSASTIAVYTVPKTGFTINNPDQCLNGNSFSFTDTSKGPAGMNRLWQLGNGDTSTAAGPAKIYTAANTYTIKLVSDNKGCKDSAMQNITINPHPKSDFTISDSIQCLRGNLFGFTDNSTITTGTFTINWDFGNGDTSGKTNPAKAYTTTGIKTVKLVARSDKGCKDSTAKTITVNGHPTATIMVLGDTSFCHGDSILLRTIPGTGYTYQWRNGSNSIAQATNETYTAKQSGSYGLIVKNAEGCADTSATTITIKVIEFPVVSLQPANKSIQETDTVQFTIATADTGTSYQWQENRGTGFNNLGSAAPYSGSATDNLSISGVPLSMDGCKYRCRLSAQGCTTTSAEALLTVKTKPVTGTGQTVKEIIKLYPNPVSNVLTVQIPARLANASYSITDQLGRTVQIGKLSNEETSINIQDIQSGVYYFSVNGTGTLIKVVKE